jgi:hypothetical protein
MSKQDKTSDQSPPTTPTSPTTPPRKNEPTEQSSSVKQSKPSGESKLPEKPKRRGKRKRRSRYKKASDAVFKLTGMALSRLLFLTVGFLLIGGLVFYVWYAGGESLPSSIEAPTAQFESGESQEQDFLTAVTIPANFAESSLPVRIDRVNWMIERCNHLLNQENDYSEKIEEKMLALLALKAVMMAESDLDPIPFLDSLKKRVAQFSSSAAQKDKHQYLLVVTYMTALATMPEADFYDDALEAINGIDASTPVPPATAISCYNSCLKYYVDSKDKTASSELLRQMGEKLAISDVQRLSDLGLTLIDYPNFSYYYQDSFSKPKSDVEFKKETLQLLQQIQKTPPQSVKTYDLLLTVPEQYLQAGNKKVAVKILNQLTEVASESNSKIRDDVLEKLDRLTTRINLVGEHFSIAGVDVAGRAITPPKKKKTLLIFWDPDSASPHDALVRIADSRLFDRWSTAVFLAPVSEITVDEIFALKRKYPNFKITDGPTAIDWMQRSGVNDTPYLIILDSEGIVRRLNTP